MATTALYPNALPGRQRSFVAKAPEGGGVKGTGPFTELSVCALPGRRHTFVAKAPEGGGVKGTGPFTELSVCALPGRRHVFVAKTPSAVRPEAAAPSPVGISQRFIIEEANRARIHRDDTEILEIITLIAPCLN